MIKLMDKVKSFFGWVFGAKLRIFVFILFFAILSYLIYFFVNKNSNDVTYQTEEVTKGTLVSTVTASGTVLTTNTLSITTEASGVVKKVYVKDGDNVFVGQKLAEITLDSDGLENYAKAYASYVSSQNGVNSANNNYRSIQSSLEKVLDEVKGHDGDETFAQKETRTKAQVASDNAYDNLRQAQANLSASSLSFKAVSPIITAPFSGTIGSVNLVEGMVITSSNSTTSVNSQRVAVIKGDSLPVVSVSLSEVDVPKVKVGQKVTVTIDSIEDKTFTGLVATVDRVGSTNSNVTSYTANIKLDSSSDLILPNMSATANIILDSLTDVLIAPSSAISESNGKTYLKVLENGNEKQVEVTVGVETSDSVEVKSGVSEGVVAIIGSTSSSSKTSTNQTKSVFSGATGGGMMMRKII